MLNDLKFNLILRYPHVRPSHYTIVMTSSFYNGTQHVLAGWHFLTWSLLNTVLVALGKKPMVKMTLLNM